LFGDMTAFKEVFAFYNELKGSPLWHLFREPLLDEEVHKSTLKFLDDFYTTINDPKKRRREFCIHVIKTYRKRCDKGLQNN
jgi:hypothetical protein